jgi:hypothetical protein
MLREKKKQTKNNKTDTQMMTLPINSEIVVNRFKIQVKYTRKYLTQEFCKFKTSIGI